jgi:lipopolysaccharide transport system ATP-binding protein
MFTALQSVSFTVRQGETLGVIGQNGAGKSTLLKILTGVLLPNGGEIRIDGRITGLLELGTGFNFEMNGLDNIVMNGMLLGMSRRELADKKAEIIDFAELGEFIDEPIKTYSSGMVMRLAFSIAIHADPKCFVVDEALSVGDAYFQQKCMLKIRNFRDNGGSIIFVSHDLNAVKILCDRAILLDHGRVVIEGVPEDVVNKYNYVISRIRKQDASTRSAPQGGNSYGSLEAEIVSVALVGDKSGSNTVSSGETVAINVDIKAYKDIANVTVGILIRDVFGQDIFGTNTFHHELSVDMKKDTPYRCRFTMPLNIGPGKYTITSGIHSHDTHIHHCYHWVDHAESFEVAGIYGQFYTGICRLSPEIVIKSVDKVSDVSDPF